MEIYVNDDENKNKGNGIKQNNTEHNYESIKYESKEQNHTLFHIAIGLFLIASIVVVLGYFLGWYDPPDTPSSSSQPSPSSTEPSSSSSSSVPQPSSETNNTGLQTIEKVLIGAWSFIGLVIVFYLIILFLLLEFTDEEWKLTVIINWYMLIISSFIAMISSAILVGRGAGTLGQTSLGLSLIIFVSLLVMLLFDRDYAKLPKYWQKVFGEEVPEIPYLDRLRKKYNLGNNNKDVQVNKQGNASDLDSKKMRNKP